MLSSCTYFSIQQKCTGESTFGMILILPSGAYMNNKDTFSSTYFETHKLHQNYVISDVRDYHSTDLLMYKEGGYRGQNTILGSHGGMDVYIRRIVPANQQANDFASTSTVH